VGWALDLDGVVWLAEQPIAGAAEAVAVLRQHTDLLFVTNNSSRPLRDYERALERIGIDAAGLVVSSAGAAATLVEPGERALLCAGPGVEEALLARGAEVVREGPADVVVVGFHRDFDYERMRIASTAVRAGARLLATNDDATYPTPDGLIPGGGAILAAIVTASGTTPTIAGKPHEPMAAVVRERLGPGGVVVGDRPETDGGFARTLGYDFVLVLSGVTRRQDLPVQPEPDLVADDLRSAVSASFPV
jgi:HAD superfamily hydrolase (TIGR01450 family)